MSTRTIFIAFMFILFIIASNSAQAQLCGGKSKLSNGQNSCCNSCQSHCCTSTCCNANACCVKIIRECGRTYKVVLTQCGPRVYVCKRRGLFGRRIVWDLIPIPIVPIGIWCSLNCCGGFGNSECKEDCMSYNDNLAERECPPPFLGSVSNQAL